MGHSGDGAQAQFTEQRWDRLVEAYREACPDIEPSAEFLPRLWQRIEAKRTLSRRIWVLTRGFVTAAGCLCLLLTALLFSHAQAPGSELVATYVEALDEHATEPLADPDELDAGVPGPSEANRPGSSEGKSQ